VILSTTGVNGYEGEASESESTQWTQLNNIFYSILDNVIGELKLRFGDFSTGLAGAVSALLPTSPDFFKIDKLQPLTMLLQQDNESDIHSSLVGELTVAEKFMADKLPADCDLQQAVHCILPFKDAFPILHWHYTAALTLGISTATCEKSFSCLTRVLRPYRRSMTHERKSSLVVLAYEKSITKALNLEEFLETFSKKSRRIQL
jgi:hypothetical protein